MKLYELMAMVAPLLRQINRGGAKADDIKHLPMMLRYEELRSKNTKKVAIVKILSDEFGVSERAIYDIVARLDNEV